MPINSQSSSSAAATGVQSASASQRPVFEYTKKKKWADHIISELPGTVILILDTSHVVMYAGPATPEVIGWLPEDLVDKDVLSIVNDDDHITFCESFDATIESGLSLSCYVRLKCKMATDVQYSASSGELNSPADSPNSPSPGKGKELLFEVRGNPVFDPPLENDGEMDIDAPQSNEQRTCKFIIMMAKPYPSRNMAIFNTFLELKMENERLTQRRNMLRAQVAQRPPQLPSDSHQRRLSDRHEHDTPAPHHTPERCILDPRINRNVSAQHSLFAPSAYSVSGSPVTPIGPFSPSPTTSSFDGRGSMDASASGRQIKFANDSGGAQPGSLEEDDDARRKRLRRNPGGAKHVCTTCGRTDSPEWRKGPEGPKTLCNACGLRWAKKGKRDEGKRDEGPTSNSSNLPISIAWTAVAPVTSPLSSFPLERTSVGARWPTESNSSSGHASTTLSAPHSAPLPHLRPVRPAHCQGQSQGASSTSSRPISDDRYLPHPIPSHLSPRPSDYNNQFEGEGQSKASVSGSGPGSSELNNWNKMNTFRW